MPTVMAVPVAKAGSTRLRIAAILAAALILIVGIVFLATRSRPSASSPAETQSAAPTAETPQAASPLPKSSAALEHSRAQYIAILPDVSPGASNTIHGTVKVKGKGGGRSNGSVSDASLESMGPSRYFSDLALQAAQQWKFRPAPGEWQARLQHTVLQFEFRHTGPSVTPSEASPALYFCRCLACLSRANLRRPAHPRLLRAGESSSLQIC